jgi:hypothetical protein
MLRVLILAGAAIVASGALVGGAHAKMVTYEVNGERFSYSTNNREQTLAARRHIEAAKAAAAAKAKADAERASNPLVAVFGSSTQREAAAAQATLAKTRPEAAAGAPSPAPIVSAAAPQQAPVQEATSTSTRRDQVTKRGPAPELAEERAPKEERVAKAAAAPAKPAQVKSVSFDAATGIKTTFMTDGSIHEEPFDGATLPTLAAEPAASKSLNAFVEQLRPVGHVETTGSTWSSAQPVDLLKRAPSRP